MKKIALPLIAAALVTADASTATAAPGMNLSLPRVDQQQTRDSGVARVGYYHRRRVCHPRIAYRYGLYGWRPYVAGYHCFYTHY